jgi:hypothetical protein
MQCDDIHNDKTTSCRDGSENCPVNGTVGSWGLYVLGILMAIAFILGPKTKFGQSEQNPAYWLQLLLVTKQSGGAKVTWYDTDRDEHREKTLGAGDPETWVRFVMSFLINGVGFHVLVHALPLQVAYQPSFTYVLFYTVGMTYAVKLDDSPGYTLHVQTKPKSGKEEAATQDDSLLTQDSESTLNTSDIGMFSAEAQRIIDEAHAKLGALATRGPRTTRKFHVGRSLVASALLRARISGATIAEGGADEGIGVADQATIAEC